MASLTDFLDAQRELWEEGVALVEILDEVAEHLGIPDQQRADQGLSATSVSSYQHDLFVRVVRALMHRVKKEVLEAAIASYLDPILVYEEMQELMQTIDCPLLAQALGHLAAAVGHGRPTAGQVAAKIAGASKKQQKNLAAAVFSVSDATTQAKDFLLSGADGSAHT